ESEGPTDRGGVDREPRDREERGDRRQRQGDPGEARLVEAAARWVSRRSGPPHARQPMDPPLVAARGEGAGSGTGPSRPGGPTPAGPSSASRAGRTSGSERSRGDTHGGGRGR